MEEIWVHDMGSMHPIHRMYNDKLDELTIIATACDMLVESILKQHNIPKIKLDELEKHLEKMRKKKK